MAKSNVREETYFGSRFESIVHLFHGGDMIVTSAQ